MAKNYGDDRDDADEPGGAGTGTGGGGTRSRLGDRLDGIVPDGVRKAIYTSLGAVFMTEDNVRRALSDIKVPKDAIGYFVNQSNKTKDELFQAIAQEFAQVLLKDRTAEELLRSALTDMHLKMNVEIEFVPKDKDAGSSLDVKVSRREKK